LDGATVAVFDETTVGVLDGVTAGVFDAVCVGGFDGVTVGVTNGVSVSATDGVDVPAEAGLDVNVGVENTPFQRLFPPSKKAKSRNTTIAVPIAPTLSHNGRIERFARSGLRLHFSRSSSICCIFRYRFSNLGAIDLSIVFLRQFGTSFRGICGAAEGYRIFCMTSSVEAEPVNKGEVLVKAS